MERLARDQRRHLTPLNCHCDSGALLADARRQVVSGAARPVRDRLKIRYSLAGFFRGAGAGYGFAACSAWTTAMRAIMTMPRFSAAAMRHAIAVCQCSSSATARGRAGPGTQELCLIIGAGKNANRVRCGLRG